MYIIKRSGSEDRSLWYSAAYLPGAGGYLIVLDMLISISQVAPEPLQGHTSYSVIVEFFYKYFMVNCVEGLGEVPGIPQWYFHACQGTLECHCKISLLRQW